MISLPVQLASALAASEHSNGLANDVPKFLLDIHVLFGYIVKSPVGALVGL